MNVITNTAEETQQVGLDFSKQLKSGDVVLLYGDLGVGKTTFVQAVAKGLGIKDRILSPTFVLIRQYKIPHPNPLLKGEGKRRSSRQARTIVLYHIDLYRIEKPAEIESLGLSEIIEEENSVTLIEWADRLSSFKPKHGYSVKMRYIKENKREIEILEI